MCAVPTCTDVVKNGTETDVDCGGSCATKCAVTKVCNVDADCASNTCFNKVCVNTPTFTAVTPNRGPTTGGTAVTLNGTNFFPVGMAATSVTFGGTAGGVPNITAATTATTTTPARLNQIGLVNVVLTLPGNHVYTLLNGFRYYYGQLGFNAAVSSGVATAYSGLVAVDMDKDGDLDIVAIRPAANTVDILRNNGAGVYAVSASVGIPAGGFRIAAADFNNDTNMDVAVSATNAVSLIRGNGAGGVLSTTNIAVAGTLRGIAAVNIDGLNGTDILVASASANSVARLLNNGAGGFTVTNNFVPALPGAFEMASADFNGDARPDFIVTSATSGATISACRNNAGTSYVCNNITSPQVNSSVATGDVNSDGKMDFVLASPASNVVMAYTGDGAFNFTQNATNALANTWNNFKLADIDKDGFTDIVFASSANQVGICRGDNTGKFLAATGVRTLTATPSQVVVGLLNADAKEDFAVSTTANGLHVAISNAQ